MQTLARPPYRAASPWRPPGSITQPEPQTPKPPNPASDGSPQGAWPRVSGPLNIRRGTGAAFSGFDPAASCRPLGQITAVTEGTESKAVTLGPPGSDAQQMHNMHRLRGQKNTRSPSENIPEGGGGGERETADTPDQPEAPKSSP